MENYTLDGATGVERTLDVGVPVVEQAVGGGSGDRVEAINGLLGAIAGMGFSVPLLGWDFSCQGPRPVLDLWCQGPYQKGWTLLLPGFLTKGLDLLWCHPSYSPLHLPLLQPLTLLLLLPLHQRLTGQVVAGSLIWGQLPAPSSSPLSVPVV